MKRFNIYFRKIAPIVCICHKVPVDDVCLDPICSDRRILSILPANNREKNDSKLTIENVNIFDQKSAHLFMGKHANLAYLAHLCCICPRISGHPGSITFFALIFTEATTPTLVWCLLIGHSLAACKYNVEIWNECGSFSSPNTTELSRMINIVVYSYFYFVRLQSHFLGIYHKL